MNINPKLIYLDGMAFNDVTSLLTTSEIKSYLDLRHRTRKNSAVYDEARVSKSVISNE